MEELKHECGVAMIRLLKPLDYYEQKYGTWAYGFDKLYLMMEKQHNRGQEGAGLATVNMEAKAGSEYMFREKAEGKDAINEIFARVRKDMAGQLYMGHLRYSTTGKTGLKFVHPFLRRNNWRAKNLCLCGNFNMTNIGEIFEQMIAQGQSPRIYSDSYITLDLMGHRLDREVERVFGEAERLGLQGTDITRYIDDHVDMANVLRSTMKHYDGGYVMAGLTGSGEMFVMRDPWAIRPAFFFRNDEILAVASERPVIQTAFLAETADVEELKPGQALIVRRSGETSLVQILQPKGHHPCSFERIYFSRGNDHDIYRERKRLGELLTRDVMKAVDGDVQHAVFSFIPNTAEVPFYGLVQGFRSLGHDVRTEKVAWKDMKMRTFIAEDKQRDHLAAHVYDITYGALQPYADNLVVIDDSIVRGTTLRESIFKILDRLHPKKLVMVSSSPQIRYPDFYGIDMPRLGDLCAFQATIALIRERGLTRLLDEVDNACREELKKPTEEMTNCVRAIYEPFSVADINSKIAQLLRPEGMEAPVELVFQTIDGLHQACPQHHGDWYFTGHYPTPGGTRLVNMAFVDFMESEERRAESSPLDF